MGDLVRETDADMDEDEEAQADDDFEIIDASTRAAFNALRGQYKNTFEFVKALYVEPGLQLRMRMIIDGSLDLHSEYSSQLEQESEGQSGMLAYASERAMGQTWYPTVCKIIQRFSSATSIERLNLTPHAFNQPQTIEDLENDPDLEQEKVLLRQFYDLLIGLASRRSWSQAFYGLTFPYCGARLMTGEATQANLVRRLARGILKLELEVNNKPQLAILQKLLKDVGTNYWLVTREMFIAGNNADWSIDDPELRDMCFALFAGPNGTKGALESTFSHVKDAAKRYNRNQRNCGPDTKWLYTCTSPYAQQAGLKQIRLDSADFVEFQQVGLTRESFGKSRLYDSAKHAIGDVVPAPEQIVLEARKAGPETNQASAAAAALILHSMDRSFDCVGDAWAGDMVILDYISLVLILVFASHNWLIS